VSTHTCPRCGIARPRTAEHFYLTPRGWITGYCRSCHAAYVRDYRRTLTPYARDRYNARRRRYRARRVARQRVAA
jgi:hypothetical protein